MPRYDVHLYREMRLLFEGIEAPSHEEAAALARQRSGEDADFIDDCHGEDFAALVDVAGDEQYQQSRMIDFEGERPCQATPKMLQALRGTRRLILDMGRIIRSLDDNHEWLEFWVQDGVSLSCDSRFDAIDAAIAAAVETATEQK